jgi:transcriptional regulator with XRE-family HTH domain
VPTESIAKQTRVPPLRTIRQAQGLTLRQVADQAGVDIGQLSRVERGQGGLSIAALIRVADVLGLRQLTQMLGPYAATDDKAAA